MDRRWGVALAIRDVVRVLCILRGIASGLLIAFGVREVAVLPPLVQRLGFGREFCPCTPVRCARSRRTTQTLADRSGDLQRVGFEQIRDLAKRTATSTSRTGCTAECCSIGCTGC